LLIDFKPLSEELKILPIYLLFFGFLDMMLSIILINEFFSIEPSLSNIFSNFIFISYLIRVVRFACA